MPPQQAKLRSITLAGFRAYLDEQTIDFGPGRSLVVFAPNAKGKSSLVDALEFTLSREGTVRRLGERSTSVQGGRQSLYHHDAEARGITPSVQITIAAPGGALTFKRSAKSPEALPEAISKLAVSMKVPFVIRGFELRQFVEQEQPRERYESVARWFGFEPLLRTQNSLRTLRLDIKREIDGLTVMQALDRECARLTGRQIAEWNEGKVIDWYLSKFVTPLNPELKLVSLSGIETFRDSVSAFAKNETQAPNMTQHKSLLAQVEALVGIGSASNKPPPILEAISSLAEVNTAQQAFEATKVASANAIFDQVWTEAERLLGNTEAIFDECPVCETPFSLSPAGSRDELRIRVKLKLDRLSALKEAEAALAKKKRECTAKVSAIRDRVFSIATVCDSLSLTEVKDLLNGIIASLSAATATDLPMALGNALESLKSVVKQIEVCIQANAVKAGTTTWASALTTLDDIIALKRKVDHEVRRKQRLHSIHDQIVAQESLVNQHVKAYVDDLIRTLTDLTNFFYKEIQSGTDRVPMVRLVLPPQDRQVQQALELLIDFSDNRKGVAPAGYLSDSQVHTLALSLRFAAIKLFNKEFPLTILDDVVTSYDSDFRATISAVLAKHFPEQQMVVVTHDEQFFNQLQDHLSQATWIFKRITKIDPTFGPKYAEHRVADQQIEDDHSDGKSATNKIRQAEEDWLTDICRDFGVNVRIRDVNHPYKFSRAELAVALHRFLAEIGRKPPLMTEYQNPFLLTLQRGTIENMGSHFTDNPYASSSLGDEQQRWSHFKEFRAYFSCSSCGKSRFIRPEGVKVPFCRGCQTPFMFRAVEAAI